MLPRQPSLFHSRRPLYIHEVHHIFRWLILRRHLLCGYLTTRYEGTVWDNYTHGKCVCVTEQGIARIERQQDLQMVIHLIGWHAMQIVVFCNGGLKRDDSGCLKKHRQVFLTFDFSSSIKGFEIAATDKK